MWRLNDIALKTGVINIAALGVDDVMLRALLSKVGHMWRHLILCPLRA
jgi:hypothetical protein